MVKYIDYLAGRQSGLYAPASSPDIENSYQDHILNICTEEMWRERARITVRKMYE
jgi:hypothetical protein